MKLLLLTFLLAALLVGCGGGDPDEPETDAGRVPVPRVDCKAHPEQCV